jgi:hypothetical protein
LPPLFISFIDDVSSVILFCCFHIYADDLQIYHSSSVADLQRCYDSTGSNGLKINPKKSKVILIQRRVGDVPQPEMFIGPESIEVVPRICSEQELDGTVNFVFSTVDWDDSAGRKTKKNQ